MTEIDDRVAQLEAELAEMKRLLLARDATPSNPSAPKPGLAARAEEVNRRALMRKGGLALAGAAAGGAAILVGSNPAAAANGDPLLVGQITTATAKTTLRTTSGATQVFELDPSSATVAPLRLSQQITSATPVSGAGDTGSLATRLRNTGGADLWFAHAGDDKAGSGPITWGRVLTSAYANYTSFLATPARKVDTRSTAKPVDGSTSTFVLADVPASAIGCIGTITIADTTSAGSYVSIYNGDVATIASPSFSHVNAGAGESVATTFTSALGASRSLKVYVFKSCHVLIDIAAWVVTAP